MMRAIRDHAILAASAIGIVILAGVVADAAHRAWRYSTPVEAWMRVVEHTVPDHKIGEDPGVRFVRDVSRDVTGLWIMEIHDEATGQQQPRCTGWGVQLYRTEEPAQITVPLRSWVGAYQCSLAPGRYRITGTFNIWDGTGSVKVLPTTSNVFEVAPE